MLHYSFFPPPCKLHIRKSKEYRRKILENIFKEKKKGRNWQTASFCHMYCTGF